VLATHTSARASHAPEAQSASSLHFWPPPQPEHSPPQSTSVSLPSWTWSPQSLVTQRCEVASQANEAQSPPRRQCFPRAQGRQPPPQSTSVSLPSSTWSVQLIGPVKQMRPLHA
jgi:hypothetical protein